MRQATIRWTFYLLALLVLGPMAAILTANLRASDGGPHATAFTSTSAVAGMIATLVAFVLAAAAGIAAARLTTARAGMTTAGLILAWAAWRSGEVEHIIRTAHSASPMIPLAIEGALSVILVVAVAFGIDRYGGLDHTSPVWPGPADSPPRPPTTTTAEALRSLLRISPMSLAGATAAGGVAAWLVAAQGLKGQTVAAAIVSGLAAAAVGRAIDIKAHATALMLPGVVIALAGPIIGLVLSHGAIVDAMYAGTLAPIARIAPLDWAAGWLLGLPMGLGWATSLVSERMKARQA